MLSLLFLLFVLVQGCATKSDDSTPRNSGAPNGSNKKTDDSKARAQEDSLAVRKAIIDRLRHRGFTGEVRGISVIDYVGDMLSGRIVAVEANDTLMYFVVYDLEDKDGNTYPRAEPLSGMNASVVYLLKNRPPSASEPQKE